MANENNKFLSFSGLETLVEQIYNVFLTKNSATSTYTTKKEFDQFKQNIGDIVQVDTSNLATKLELKVVSDQVNKNKSDIGNCLTKTDAEKTYAKNPSEGVYAVDLWVTAEIKTNSNESQEKFQRKYNSTYAYPQILNIDKGLEIEYKFNEDKPHIIERFDEENVVFSEYGLEANTFETMFINHLNSGFSIILNGLRNSSFKEIFQLFLNSKIKIEYRGHLEPGEDIDIWRPGKGPVLNIPATFKKFRIYLISTTLFIEVIERHDIGLLAAAVVDEYGMYVNISEVIRNLEEGEKFSIRIPENRQIIGFDEVADVGSNCIRNIDINPMSALDVISRDDQYDLWNFNAALTTVKTWISTHLDQGHVLSINELNDLIKGGYLGVLGSSWNDLEFPIAFGFIQIERIKPIIDSYYPGSELGSGDIFLKINITLR